MKRDYSNKYRLQKTTDDNSDESAFTFIHIALCAIVILLFSFFIYAKYRCEKVHKNISQELSVNSSSDPHVQRNRTSKDQQEIKKRSSDDDSELLIILPLMMF